MRDISLILCYNEIVMKKTAFIGHRKLFQQTLEERLKKAIEDEIQNGCLCFTMGTHGAFDFLALRTCKKLRKLYPNIRIEAVITSMNIFKSYEELEEYSPFYEVDTVMYEIEQVHYKQQITLSNRKMIDSCDTLICYVDEKTYRSGAKNAMRYAKKKGLRIINLYREEDRPFYGKSHEEVKKELDKQFKELIDK